MSVRRLVVEVDTGGLNVAEFCRSHGISRWFFYDLRRRYATEGEAALEPRSRAPKTVRNRTSAAVEQAIIDERKRLEGEGLDAGAATIAFHLAGQLGRGVATPSEATIWRVLSRRGFITPQPDKAPKHAHRSFQAERANQCWQIDDTEWWLAGGREVKIINILDDRTRLLVASVAVTACSTAAAFEAFCRAAQEWGWPTRFLSDNAKAFRHGLADALRPLGVAAGHSRPYHPQTCGKVERFHQTLKKRLSAHPPMDTLAELQTQLDEFARLYNHQRPHRSLGRQTPAQVFAHTPKAGPADRPLGEPTHLHHVTVHGGVCHINKDYSISVGAAHTGHTATVIITGVACHVFITGRLIRQLTLNPTQRSQPLHNRPGRPPNLPTNP